MRRRPAMGAHEDDRMISELTREVCARLCIDQAMQMEIERLDWKAAIINSSKSIAISCGCMSAGRMRARRLERRP